MAIQLKCPQCGAGLKVADKLAGKHGNCPRCSGRIDIPASSLPEPPPSQPSPPVVAPLAIATVAPQPLPITTVPVLWLVAIGDQQFGPIDEPTVRQWVNEHRVSLADYARKTSDLNWTTISAAFNLAPVMAGTPANEASTFAIDLVPRTITVNVLGIFKGGGKDATSFKRGNVLDGDTVIRRRDHDLTIEIYTIGGVQAAMLMIVCLISIIGCVFVGMFLLYPNQNNWMALENLPAQFTLRAAFAIAIPIVFAVLVAIGRAIGRKHVVQLDKKTIANVRSTPDPQVPEQTRVSVQLHSDEQITVLVAKDRARDVRRMLDWAIGRPID